jgi:hypothetical protein
MDNKATNKKTQNANMENENTNNPKNNDAVKPGKGAVIATYPMMDDHNKKAADVLVSQGTEAAVKFMFKHPTTGQQMDYATMRYYYG